MSLDPPIPIEAGNSVLFIDPWSNKIVYAIVAKFTRKHVLLNGPNGNRTAMQRGDILGCSPRCGGHTGEERCQRAAGHKGRHFTHWKGGTIQWTDKKRKTTRQDRAAT